MNKQLIEQDACIVIDGHKWNVEYSYHPPSGDGWDEPYVEEEWIIHKLHLVVEAMVELLDIEVLIAALQEHVEGLRHASSTDEWANKPLV